MKKQLWALTLSFGLVAMQSAWGHGRYILPSHTVLSGKDAQAVTLSASISNDFFHPDRPFGDDGQGKVDPFLKDMFKHLEMGQVSPDGKVSDLAWRAYARQSVADLDLEQSGTYRVFMVQPDTPVVTFKNADGAADRVFGFDTPLPEGATGVKKRTFSSRVESFVSFNEPNEAALKPLGKGLELSGNTHPNDVFVGEENAFQLVYNGQLLSKPADVHITRGGTRHRNQRDALELSTDKEGQFVVTFDQPGFYLLEANYAKAGNKNSGIDLQHYGLYVTFEVFPE